MAPSPEHRRAHELLTAEITRVSKKAKLPFRTLTDLVNTDQRYPELIPLLIDWLPSGYNRCQLSLRIDRWVRGGQRSWNG